MSLPSAASRRKQLIAERAAEFRTFPAWSVEILWDATRAGALGVQFRRQVPVSGSFIADSLTAELQLIVEIDRLVHARKVEADARRERELRHLGFTVLRLPSKLVEQQLPDALGRIREAIELHRGQ